LWLTKDRQLILNKGKVKLMALAKTQKTVVVFLLASLCLSCGFKLKQYQALDSSLASIALKSPISAAQFSYRLEIELKKRGVLVSEQATTQLNIIDYQQTREAASINTNNARQTETRLTNKVTFNLLDAEGKILLEPTTLSRNKEYYNDSSNIAGKVAEERMLQQEIDSVLIDLILRHLEAVNSESSNTLEKNSIKPGNADGTARSAN